VSFLNDSMVDAEDKDPRIQDGPQVRGTEEVKRLTITFRVSLRLFEIVMHLRANARDSIRFPISQANNSTLEGFTTEQRIAAFPPHQGFGRAQQLKRSLVAHELVIRQPWQQELLEFITAQ
jgi:hypothetical protein